MIRYRVGDSWGITVVETDNEDPEGLVRRHDNDRLVGMARTPEDARLIVEALNAHAAERR